MAEPVLKQLREWFPDMREHNFARAAASVVRLHAPSGKASRGDMTRVRRIWGDTRARQAWRAAVEASNYANPPLPNLPWW